MLDERGYEIGKCEGFEIPLIPCSRLKRLRPLGTKESEESVDYLSKDIVEKALEAVRAEYGNTGESIVILAFKVPSGKGESDD